MDLAVYMKEPAVRVLGPGVRYALWVQGCPRRCPGCVAENAWDPDGGERIPVDALAVEIVLSGAEGLTVSGGEPFLQAEALAELLEKVKKTLPDERDCLHGLPFGGACGCSRRGPASAADRSVDRRPVCAGA